MKLSTNLLKSIVSKKPHQSFSNIPFHHGTLSYNRRFTASMVDQTTHPNYTRTIKPSFLISILRNSVKSRSLDIGKMVHACISKSGITRELLLVNNLLHVYSFCLSVPDALKLFEEMPARDVVSWNTIISGLVRSGFSRDGFSVYRDMRQAGIWPSQSSFASVLVTSESCRQIHGESLKCGFYGDLVVGNALLTAYVKDGDIESPRKLFHEMESFDQVSVEILLRGYAEHGICIQDAFELFSCSLLSQVTVSCFALSSLISLCMATEAIDNGIQIHGYVVKVGLGTDVSIVNSLITLYSRSYLLEDAIYLFDEATGRDIVTWNSLIAGCAFNNQGDVGMGFLARFLSCGMTMNESTFSSFLSCCANVSVLGSVKKAHARIMKLRDSRDTGVDNIILKMYSGCVNFKYASVVFNTIEERDTISYHLMVGLFRNQGLYEESIRVLNLIQLEGFKADEYVYSSLISSCTRLVDSEAGQQIHGCVVKTGFDMTVHVGNSLLEMYSRCKRFDDMEKFFAEMDFLDVFSWNTMVMGYANFGVFNRSIEIWEEMRESHVVFNQFSYCAMIDISGCIEAPLMGRQIHARIKKLGLSFDTTLMNSLLTMYAACGMIEKASMIFEETPSSDSISWNAMVCGYAQNGFISESLKLYLKMNSIGFKPNSMTFASISKVCGDHSELVSGLQFHSEVIKRGFEEDVTVSNSFITMYAKCGNIHEASKIFQNSYRDVVTWNSIICAYAHHGFGREALDMFAEMISSGEIPNGVTFVGLLSACDHAGLVREAFVQFDSMYKDHGIEPGEDHYACMVDILCRAGRLQEAKDMIDSMPYIPCSLIWRTLLSACSINENIELGEVAAEKLMQLEPNDSSAYILLSNIYASKEKMGDKVEMRKRMGDRNVKKDIGYSWISS